jgi:hypothetical protein
MQPTTVARRLTLADLAILIVATAFALMATRSDLAGLVAVPKSLENGRLVQRWSYPVALGKAITLEVWLMSFSAGWLIVQLRAPRPGLRQLVRQPGFVACFTSTVVTIVAGGVTWPIIASAASGANAWLDRAVWSEVVSAQIGSAVLADWTMLAISRRCRVRAGWLDRVGQLIGLVWIAMIPANVAHFFWNSGWTN